MNKKIKKMIMRYSLQTNLRSKKRTKLFVVLIFSLTLAVVLSLGIMTYADKMIAKCNEVYHSVIRAEYMGEEYPEKTANDKFSYNAYCSLMDLDTSEIDGVTYYQPQVQALGFSEGFYITSDSVPYKQKAVIIANTLRHVPLRDGVMSTYYASFVRGAIYSYTLRDSEAIVITDNVTGIKYDSKKTYILHGYYDTAKLYGVRSFYVTSFEEYPEESPVVEYDEKYLTSGVFYNVGTKYKYANTAMTIDVSPDIEDSEPFHQGYLHLLDGSFPTDADSCVITNDIAAKLDLKVGDDIDISFIMNTSDEMYDIKGLSSNKVFKISGISSDSRDYLGYVFVTSLDEDVNFFGFDLGYFRVDNNKAGEVLEKLEGLGLTNVRYSLYDQGYSHCVEPFKTIKTASMIVFLVSSCAVLTVLVFFAFMFIGTQADTVNILYSLGTRSGDIDLFLLSGAFMVSSLSALAGAVLGTGLLPLVIKLINLLQDVFAKERYYSETMLSATRDMEVSVGLPIIEVSICVLTIILVTLLLCFVFLIRVKNGRTKKGKVNTRVIKGTTSIAFKGGFRFSWLSLLRNGSRSLIVPCVVAVLTVTIVIISSIYASWNYQIKNASKTMSISGNAVSLDGRFFYNLAVPATTVKEILDIDHIENVSYSKGWNYYFSDEVPDFSSSSYGAEHFEDWVVDQPMLVSLNDIKASKQFFYADCVVTYMEGYDESVLSSPCESYAEIYMDQVNGKESEVIPCIVSESLLERRGLKFGDVTQIVMVKTDSGKADVYINVKIVGSYASTSSKPSVFVPLSFVAYEGAFEDPIYVKRISFDTLRFDLTSGEYLEEVREALNEKGFSYPGYANSIRTGIVIQDASYMDLVDTLGRYILIGKFVFAVLFILVWLVGFIMSYLMVNSRKNEFFVMKSLGAPKNRVFYSFFIEQMLLCVIGLILGLLSSIYFGVSFVLLIAGALFLSCYLFGCSLCINSVGKINMMEMMQEE